MATLSILLIVSVLLLGYVNGANDNFKGVATLFGSGTASYYRALAWATSATLAGSMLAMVLAGRLIETFQGKGLVPESTAQAPAFLVAVSMGAALTVLLATWLGLPVATTHALTGALIGAGWLAAGSRLHLGTLSASFVLPLVGSPVAAMLLTVLAYPAIREVRSQRTESQKSEDASSLISDLRPLTSGHSTGVKILDGLHYLSAGAVSFARGVNATPKIVALLLAAQALDPDLGLALVAAAMAMGGIISAWPVADTLSRKITPMNPMQGLVANLVTATLMMSAGCLGLPASTTHVSVGSLFGIGLVNGTANRKPVVRILLAWVTTVPLGAGFAAGILWLLEMNCG